MSPDKQSLEFTFPREKGRTGMPCIASKLKADLQELLAGTRGVPQATKDALDEVPVCDDRLNTKDLVELLVKNRKGAPSAEAARQISVQSINHLQEHLENLADEHLPGVRRSNADIQTMINVAGHAAVNALECQPKEALQFLINVGNEEFRARSHSTGLDLTALHHLQQALASFIGQAFFAGCSCSER